MRILSSLLLIITSFITHADTMGHYMHISQQIPQMEMKADPESQAWARSARIVLAVANESIAETLVQANESARHRGAPLFCLPSGVTLNSTTLNSIILKTYQDISSQQSDKEKMTVSQTAWLGVTKAYPCNNKMKRLFSGQTQAGSMKHVSGL